MQKSSTVLSLYAAVVGPAKMRRIRLTAIDYLNTVDHKGRFDNTRFDVATVTNGCVSYYEGVF